MALALRQHLLAAGADLPGRRKGCRHMGRTFGNDEVSRALPCTLDITGRGAPAVKHIALRRRSRQEDNAASGVCGADIMHRTALAGGKGDLVGIRFGEVGSHGHIPGHRETVGRVRGNLLSVPEPADEGAAADRIGR